MNILILGAGQVGTTAAQHLAKEEANEVTIVDSNAAVLRDLQDRLDVRTVIGQASFPDILERAGAREADMIIALTNSDEINMIACQVAYTIFQTPTKIARIRASEYIDTDELWQQASIPVDFRISPEELVTQHIEQLIHYPGAFQVLEFADGAVRLVGARAHRGGLLVGQQIKTLHEHIPDIETRIAAIYRNGRSIEPDGNTLIQENDEVFFIAAYKDIRVVMSEMRKLEDPVRRVVIAGGGNIGFRLATLLEQTNQVKIIDHNKRRAKKISELLDKTIVLHGDAADEELLIEENVDNADIFVALTNAEEANILSAMVAKQLGCKKVMSLINRPAYAELVESGAIDVAISPRQITIGSLLAHVRRGDVVKVHSLRRGRAEAMEAIAHGTEHESMVVGRAIEDIKLPPGTSINALVRGSEVMQAHHDTVIKTDDHVIMFITDCRQTEEVERLFQINVKI
ncbi:MAG TPA: Trk system potassium transporter TrkA [Gammaproteobacteria bacterium]|jgi:trk system potassium uptake protein TrkA|nr:Trk system potassium transporter TrkA [Chromatiales bacterium]MCP4925139.1 Trk system potassium transporter TrkA [Gammaproteobacteria bacterium]MDP7154593.1 Trk system potassium transporter TrkA [Gammaproteobacteria bacterium]MDP7296497.1 Trk system potassium transporter TrkA [Gammaproteobacteria bacterium]MDP7660395.1 Trk system potassium transporter TrkA [Gammaproteobacteria bacterium]